MRERFRDPRFLRHFHGWAVVVWATLGLFITVLFPDSVLWVAVMSLWANVGTHWAAWQAARVEDPDT